MGASGLGILVLAASVLVASYRADPVLGLAPQEFAWIMALLGLGLVLAGWIVTDFRHRWSVGFRALVVWGAVYAGFVAAYAQRDQLLNVLDRAIGEVDPGRTAVTEAGEVVVARRVNGSFTLSGRVNNRETRFLFDTGASTVVLSAQAAAAAGIRADTLNFSIPVATANGRTLTAPVILDSLSVGPIVEHKVPALVARPGVLPENLLGMTFLERLASYEVRGNRLILRPKPS
jgi:aspartyl protease family protein